jgi:hypothetical protein
VNNTLIIKGVAAKSILALEIKRQKSADYLQITTREVISQELVAQPRVIQELELRKARQIN